MSKSDLWVRGDRHTHTQTDTRINNMTRPGLGAGPSDNKSSSYNRDRLNRPCWPTGLILDLIINEALPRLRSKERGLHKGNI